MKSMRKADKAAFKALEIAERSQQQSFEIYLNFDTNPKKTEQTYPQKEPILGRWTEKEHQDYVLVLKQNIHTKKQIFTQLLKKLPTRSDSQIRAHHQKLLKKFGSVQGIIDSHFSPSDNMLKAVRGLENILSKLKEHFKESGQMSTDPNE